MPQATTVPSLFEARLWQPPAAMATTPLRPAAWLRHHFVAPGHHRAVALQREAAPIPAAIAATPLRPPGTGD